MEALSNVNARLGRIRPTLLDRVRLEALASDAPEESAPTRTSGRGRRLGSTNWSKERFWRRYKMAAQKLDRPYRRTHLACRMNLTIVTFNKYLGLWHPPEGFAGPGD